MKKVKFIYAYPLDVNRRNLYESKGLGEYPDIGQIKEKIKHWEEIWNKANKDDQIINYLIDLCEEPERASECFVIGAGMRPMSAPLLIPIIGRDGERSDEEFLETLIHEIIHVFVEERKKYWRKFVDEEYKEESKSTQNHIIVYAILEDIYKKFFNSLPGDFGDTDLPDSYIKAIDIVKKEGREKIIKDFIDNK